MRFFTADSRFLSIRALRGSSLALCALLTACGGGGGSDDSDDFFQVLAFYDFAITNPAGAPPALTRTLVAPAFPTEVYTIDAGTGSIRGRYFTNDFDFTIADTTSYTVNWSQGGPTPAQFSVGFTSQASYPDNSVLPSSGAFAVTWGSDTITVDYGATVDIALNGGAPVQFTPVAFSLLDVPSASPAPDWQRVAARASRALVDVLGLARGVPEFLEKVNNGDLDSGQSVTTCTTIPGSPPVGASQTGEIVAVELSGGDRYRSTYTDCFFQSGAAPTRGILATGIVDRNNLLTTVEGGSQGGNLVEFGFVGSAQSPGGVTYTTETLNMTESTPGTWTFDGFSSENSGGFSILFTYPP